MSIQKRRPGTVSPFQYEDFEVRWGGTKDRPYFVAQDLAMIHGIKNIRSAIADFPDDEKGVEEGLSQNTSAVGVSSGQLRGEQLE